MKCCDIHAGLLRAKISIERATSAADGMGGTTTTWAEVAAPYALVKGLGGGERWAAMRVSADVRKRAIIRFDGDANGAPSYSGADRVIYKGRTHSIESVIDIEDRQTWLELMLVEGVAT